MGFPKSESEALLAATGRRCCICGILHKVQLHHIIPTEDGGKDDIDNAIPLCPNCHDEVHGSHASGKTTRLYSAAELRRHRERTIKQVEGEGKWKAGTSVWDADRDLVLFYAQCLDRSAFRAHFHQELSFAAFDRAMEDTLVALNTGFWRLRDGTLLGRAKGKSSVVNGEWREKLAQIVSAIEQVRARFHEAVGFNRMLYEMHGPRWGDFEMEFGPRFRGDQVLSAWMDERRNHAIELMNSILSEIGHPPLEGIRAC
jgi:hypothetical protein